VFGAFFVVALKIKARGRKMNVEEYAFLVSLPYLLEVKSGFYLNCRRQRGYFACYRLPGGCFVKYSVSATELPVAPDEVATAIQAPGRWIQRQNPYSNRKNNEGFEATVYSGGHAFMLGVASKM
jgi:hypothetical protein